MNTPSERRSRAWLPLALISSAAALSLVSLALAATPATPPSSATQPETQNSKLQTSSPASPALALFQKTIQPILEAHCYECHADGVDKAGIAFDKLSTDDQLLHQPDLWLKVIKNTRAGLMPADGNPRLSAQDQATLDNWIEFTAFGLDPKNLDPGRVTVHRLNRAEYRNTIHDLLGVDFDTTANFPADDIGYGFDNIADVLNVSSLLMEKYLAAAQSVVDQSVPTVTRVAATQFATGKDFLDADTGKNATNMSYFTPAKVSHTFPVSQEGDYNVVVDEGLISDATFTTASCNVTILFDGQQVSQKISHWHGTNTNAEIFPTFSETIPVHWKPGDHDFTMTIVPEDTGARSIVSFQIRKVTIVGPTDEARWVHPPNYERFFTRDAPPTEPAARRAYAHDILNAFATKAYRRPMTDDTVDQLTAIAEKIYNEPGNTFEIGIARAITAILASPRFLFRIDATAGAQPAPFAQIDEYSLASRLSYFLWSTMPDDKLMQLAAAGRLRQNLAAEVQRLVADPRADNFINSFSSQWLQSRAVTNVPINAHEIFLREDFKAPASYDLTPAQREALEAEAQAYFGYVLRADRSVDEFIDSNYAFFNSTLANYYFDGELQLKGNEMRKVELSAGDWRGGILTLGSVLMVTSNPTRTSPVKRGKWILENILDAPAPPPPANIPPLEASDKDVAGHTPTMREVLAKHRADPNCSSCHDRMDPLGLALENFNALGTWRSKDMKQPVDATGQLITGEKFNDIRELKKILLTNHREEFYRCLTQKLLTYALGRGVEYYDVPTVDKIVDNMDKDGGKFSALLMGVIDSAAFQEERLQPASPPAKAAPLISQNTPRP